MTNFGGFSMRIPTRLFAGALLSLLSMPLHAAITGTVVNTDGAAVGGAKVALYAQETNDARRARHQSKTIEKTPLATTTSDSRGNFKFETPKDAVVDVRIEAKGFAPEAVRALADDELGAIALTSAPTVTGKITAGGKPVAGAVVVLLGGAEYVTTTDEQGKYSAPEPAKWANRMMVIHPDYAFVDEITGNDPSKKGADRALSSGVEIKGKVVADNGTPASGASIFVDNWELAKSGADGTFSVAHAMKDWSQIEARTADKNAVRSRSGSAIVLKLAKAASVSGTVVDAKTQLPLAGAAIQLNPSGNFGGLGVSSRQGYTDAKGHYTLSPVVPGIFSMNVSRPGASMPAVSVSVAANQSVQKQLYMTSMARVSGTVSDDDKRPVAGARVAATSSNRGDGIMMMIGNFRPGNSSITGPDGRFVLRGVQTDADIRVGASKKGFPAADSATLRLAPAERKSGVNITIPRGVALTGKVTDGDGKPLSGVAVDAAAASNDFGGANLRRIVMAARNDRGDDMVHTGSDGTFTLRVKEGTYDVVFKREGFAAKTARGVQVNASSKPVEVSLEPGVEVSGRVTRGGTGVEGVNVGIASMDGFTNTTTGPDGSFHIADLTPGQMMMNVSKREDFIQVNRMVTAPAKDVTVELPPGGKITGRVVDKSSHRPVTSFEAGVTTSRSGGGMMIMMPPMLRHFTSDDGSFVLENVPPGPTQVTVSAPGFTTARVPSINVEDGKTVSDLEVVLDTGVKLTGRVTGPDGSAVAGVTVRLDEQGGNAPRMMRMGGGAENTAITDPNGDYSIDALEPGEKSFAFNRQGYLTETRTINLSGDRARLDVTLSSGTRLSGVVVTEAGAPVAEAQVFAASAADSGFGKSVRSDSNGAFQFEGLASGHYTFTASKNGYANGIVRDFDVSTGAPIRITMKNGAVIIGHVSGLTEKELAEATVMANSQNGNSSTSVDSSGSFRLEGAPSGTVRVVARVGAGFGGNFKSSTPKTIELEPGGSAQVDIEFKSTTVVRGRVTRNGAPLSNAMVQFMSRGGRAAASASATTDDRGMYSVTGLEDATYNVQVVDMQRLSPFASTYEVKGSGNFDIDIKATSIRGRVVNSTTRAPVAEARIEIHAPGGGGESFMSSRMAETDSMGGFIIDNVARGTYEAVASAQGFGHATKNVTVEDSPEELEFELSPASGIKLTAVDARDRKPLSANVRVTDMAGREIQPMAGRMFGGGSAEPIQLDLAPGSYRVTVLAQYYAPVTMTLTSPSQPIVALTPGGTLVINAKNGSARIRILDSNGQPYTRGPFMAPTFTFDHSATVQNINAGHYRVQRLNDDDQVMSSQEVDIVEGQTATISI
jgi:protocatechuate 3,4-dioxygenase beta subunit